MSSPQSRPPRNSDRAEAGPDFICPGLPKCGTGWLFDQLDSHPDFWMPPVKELLYLNEEVPSLSFLQERSRRALARSRKNPAKRVGERVLRRDLTDPRDSGFVEYASSIQGQLRDLKRYARLFEFKGALLSGDMSPPYWMITEETISSVARHFPAIKILLLVRDPVARAWSRISVFHRAGKFNPGILEHDDQFAGFLRQSRKVGEVLATELANRWLRHVAADRFRVVLFDDIVEEPGKVRHEILTFLGADAGKMAEPLAPDYNRKAEYKKLTLESQAARVLAAHFREELIASAALFGGRATEWPGRHGIR